MTMRLSANQRPAVEGGNLPPMLYRGTSGNSAPETLEGWPWRALILGTVGLTGVLQFFTPITATHWIYILTKAVLHSDCPLGPENGLTRWFGSRLVVGRRLYGRHTLNLEGVKGRCPGPVLGGLCFLSRGRSGGGTDRPEKEAGSSLAACRRGVATGTRAIAK